MQVAPLQPSRTEAVRRMLLEAPDTNLYMLGALAGGLGYLAAYFESWPVGASQTVVAAIFVALSVPIRLLRAA